MGIWWKRGHSARTNLAWNRPVRFQTPAIMLTGLSLALAAPAGAQEAGPESLQAAVDRRLRESRADLIETRRDLHRHPEVSGREERTARIVSERLRALGLEVRTGVGGHGVVGMLRGGSPGPIVAFRADMDAVATTAPDPVEFASTVSGVRHICGHDIHTTVGLALAEGLAAVRSSLPGSILFIFQPAEENATGARSMLADSIFAGGKPDAIFAYHTAPLEVGQVGTKRGALLPQRDRFQVELWGAGDLSESVDHAVATLDAQSSAARGATSVVGDFAVTQVWESGPGDRADSWVIRGSVTTTGPHVSEQVRTEIRKGLEELRTGGIQYRLDYETRFTAGVTNDPELEAESRTPLRSVLGDTGLVELESVPTQFSEDFGSFQEQVPGVMYYLGVSNAEKGWVGLPHSPGYVADEESIEIGARAMAAVILDYLRSSHAHQGSVP